jgi:hypothetical protein
MYETDLQYFSRKGRGKQLEIYQAQTEGLNADAAILSASGIVEVCLNKDIDCIVCKIKLLDCDENYGTIEQPLCKDCKKLSNIHLIRNHLKMVVSGFFLLLSYCLGIGSILVFLFSSSIWPDKFYAVSPVIGLIVGFIMGIFGEIIALVLFFQPGGKIINWFKVIAVIINLVLPIIFVGLKIIAS